MTNPDVITFPHDLGSAETYRPPADRILAGDPAQRALNLYASSDGRFNCGVWQAERGTWRVIFTESEFCYLISGCIIVTSDLGTVTTYRAGDAFVSPAGFTGTWEIVEPAKKYYAFYE